MKVRRPALKYFGGKWRLAPWIISHFPQHECYVEPFCGAASVFLRKPPSVVEVINDLDEEIINFFRVLREQRDDFVQAVEATPYSRQEYNLAWDLRGNGALPLERARRFYIRSWQGWGGKCRNRSGWSFQTTNNRGKLVLADWNEIVHLPAVIERLKHAFIENDDALKVIARYDGPRALFYCDPPYLQDLRRPQSYHCEIDEEYHRVLLERLLVIEGMVIISGYPSDLYNEYLRDWRRVETTARTTNTPNVATEIIWVSPAAVAQGQGMLW